MIGVELSRAVFRLRTYLFGAALAAVSILPVVILDTTGGSGGGPPFLELVKHSGFFGGVAGLTLIEPFFLPLGAGLLAGEAIAGEASNGTLRYLLVRPVGRSALVLSKFAAVMIQLLAAVFWVAVVGLIAGGIVFGLGALPTLSGTMISPVDALIRIGGSVLYVTAAMAGLAAIGVFISTLTNSAPGAVAATVILAIGSEIFDGLSSTQAIHPYLLTHYWLAFSDLFRSPVAWGQMGRGLEVFAVYTAIFVAAAVLSLRRRDVTA